MILPIIECLIVLFMLWVIVNVVRAVLHKATNGGGFWGIYESMTREKKKEEVKKEEVKDGSKKKGS